MKFDFPKDRKTETVTISIYAIDIDKVRSLAKKYNCTHNDIYKTLINESLEEYEKQKGLINPEKATPSYSVKRDFVEAGDNRREEVSGDKFDGSGDLRTKEAKAEIAGPNIEAKEENKPIIQPEKSGPIEQVSRVAENEEIELDEKEELVLNCEECGVALDDDNFDEKKGFVNDSFFCNDCSGKIKKKEKENKNPAAVELGRKGGLVGGNVRARVLSPERRTEIARKAANARYKKDVVPEKLPKDWWKKENLPGGAQQAYNNAKQREEENLMSKVAYCSNHYCTVKPKFIRGMGIQYKGKEFCSDPCLEKFINTGQEKGLQN